MWLTNESECLAFILNLHLITCLFRVHLNILRKYKAQMVNLLNSYVSVGLCSNVFSLWYHDLVLRFGVCIHSYLSKTYFIPHPFLQLLG